MQLEQADLLLHQQVALLGTRDWRIVRQATDVLLQAGDAGIQAAIAGMTHANPRIRRACADFMDHHGTDQCILALTTTLHDPVAYVRRQALHSLGCQRCKESPLAVDAIAPLLNAALHDASIKVRREAVSNLFFQAPDQRVIPVLQNILAQESDRMMRKHAHHSLKHHDPAYRMAVAEQARRRNLS